MLDDEKLEPLHECDELDDEKREPLHECEELEEEKSDPLQECEELDDEKSEPLHDEDDDMTGFLKASPEFVPLLLNGVRRPRALAQNSGFFAEQIPSFSRTPYLPVL